jgi:hypothetical protein
MQTELFDLPSPRTFSEAPAVSQTSFLEKTFVTLRLDQAIGLVLILLVFYVVTFSWGVEKGKGISRDSQVIRPVPMTVSSPEILPVSSAPVVPTSPATVKAEMISKDAPMTVAELPKPVAQVTRPDGKYTIQDVTYITQSAADREIEKLAKSGYKAFVIPSGKHLQVCIAAFQTHLEAIELLRKLRSQNLITDDAYVRPMVR